MLGASLILGLSLTSANWSDVLVNAESAYQIEGTSLFLAEAGGETFVVSKRGDVGKFTSEPVCFLVEPRWSPKVGTAWSSTRSIRAGARS